MTNMYHLNVWYFVPYANNKGADQSCAVRTAPCFICSLARYYDKRINILFHILTFAKPECVSVLQPKPQSGSGCNTLSHKGLANVNIQKRMLYRHCYIPSFQAQAVPNNFIQLYAKMSTVTSWSVQPIHIGKAAIENVNIVDERRSKNS